MPNFELRAQIAPFCHLRGNGSFLNLGELACRDGKNCLVFDLNVPFVNRSKLGDCLAKPLGLCRRKMSLFQAAPSQSIDLGVERIGAAMIVFQGIESGERRSRIRIRKFTHPRKERLLFVGGVLGSGFAEVTQSGFKCGASVIGQGFVDKRRDPFKPAEKHLDAAMTIRKKRSGIRKAVGLGPDLYWHMYRMRQINASHKRP